MEFFNRAQSEDLPHVSGIKTNLQTLLVPNPVSEDLPHVSGIKTCIPVRGYQSSCVGRLAPRIRASIFSDDLKPGSSENVGRILESDKYSDVST